MTLLIIVKDSRLSEVPLSLHVYVGNYIDVKSTAQHKRRISHLIMKERV